MGEVIKTACPLNCYDVCGLVVEIDENKIVSVEGDKEHPITKGKICGKGKMLKDRLYHPERLLYPLKKANDEFIRISWEQALTEISEKMLEIKKVYGPTAVLHSYDYASGGLLKELDQRFFNLYGGFTEVKGSLCWGAGIKAQEYDFGDSLSHDANDIMAAKTIIVWGRNITSTNIHLYPFIMEAKDKGVKLIVIDPLKNGIAKQADRHIAISPGLDGNLALALSKIIVEKGWHDKDFIDNYSVGFEEFIKELENINIEHISKEISIELDGLYELAEEIAKQKPVSAFLGLGMQRYSNGGNTIRAIDALFALTGNIGISGGGVNYANKQVGGSFNWQGLLKENSRSDYRVFYRPSQASEVLAANNPPIKMMFLSRSNAISQLPNTEKTIEAFAAIETKIVLDMFMTDSAKLADYVLPIASVFEEEDIYYGSMFHGIMRYGPKIVEPQGEAWSDLKIWTELAKKLGIDSFEENINNYFETALETLNGHQINLDVLKAKGTIKLPVQDIPWENGQFKTPSGKFEFYSKTALEDGNYPVARIAYPEEVSRQQIDNSYPYALLTIHPTKSLHSQHAFIIKEKGALVEIVLSNKIASENGITDGDTIYLYNDRGRVIGTARIKTGSNDNVIYVEEGIWVDTEMSINKLTSNKLSDMGYGSVIYDCAVAIEKA